MSTHSLQRVDELSSIDRCTYLEHYRFRKPFVLRGGAAGIPAFGKWTLEYLEGQIAEIQIQPLIYENDKRDYSKASFVEMTFGEFCREIRAGNGRMLYWFEGPVSANFWGGIDKHARVNADLHMLAQDFAVPDFLRESEIIYAQIILGTGKNGTVVHHDFGGEAKCLMQLMGEKHVLLIPPQYGKELALHSITQEKNFTISTLDLRGRDFAAIASAVPVFEACIRPGDVLYWPSFWLHDIANDGEINFAINAPIDEMPINPLMLRHLLAMNLARLRHFDPELDVSRETIQQLEAELLGHANVRTLWELHAASAQHRGKHWRTRKDQAQSSNEIPAGQMA
jgi:hypothetical protein